MAIKHVKVATFADQVGVEINKAEWNDSHVIEPNTIGETEVTTFTSSKISLGATSQVVGLDAALASKFSPSNRQTNIVNAEIDAAANIAKSKISTTGTWLDSEIPSILIDKQLNGSRWKIRTITGGVTFLTKEDLVLIVDTTLGTLVLPDATLPEHLHRIYLMINKSIDPFFIEGFQSQTINGQLTLQVSFQNDYVMIICDGSNWRIIADKRLRDELAASWTADRTFTNIGTVFTQCYGNDLNDKKQVRIETFGKTQVRLIVNWRRNGVGTQSIRLFNGSSAFVEMDVVSGVNDSLLIPIPSSYFDASNLVWLEAKSTTANDDPVIHSAVVYLR